MQIVLAMDRLNNRFSAVWPINDHALEPGASPLALILLSLDEFGSRDPHEFNGACDGLTPDTDCVLPFHEK